MTRLLDADDVFLSRGIRSVLAGACLSCRTREIVGLLGRNGSGKTSFLHILFGSLPGDSRSVRLDGVPVRALYLEPGAVAILPQEPFLPERFSVDRCIERFCADRSVRARMRDHELVRTLRGERISDLSGGERRRLELLLVLSLDRAFFLLDEPFSHLDPVHTEWVADLLRDRARTAGLVITDHDYRSILGACDHLVLLRDGHSVPVRGRDDLAELGYLPSAPPNGGTEPW